MNDEINFARVEATAILIDLRNFTPTFKFFDEKNSNIFLRFINKMNEFALEILNKIGLKYYITSTGDGLLILIFDKMNFKRGFAFALLYSKVLECYIKQFNRDNEIDLGYGIGLEAGHVQSVKSDGSPNYVQTYLGNVINIAARIEAETKTHARANVIIGENINNLLVKDIFKEDYEQLVKLTLSSQNKNATETINKMNDLNQRLMLSYLFEHRLKGVEKPQKIFRVSPTLSKIDGQIFWPLLKKLLPGNRFLEIKETVIQEIK